MPPRFGSVRVNKSDYNPKHYSEIVYDEFIVTTLQELKLIAKHYRVASSGTKLELAIRLLDVEDLLERDLAKIRNF